jgi:demethylmenaquinone methyltransferase/2-methoxy-6-polyprenyl-1,4-benzoquinol methylase
MAADVGSRSRHARALFAGLPDRYDRLAEVLSFGQNGRWRAFMVSRLRAPAGGRVLDVATGTAGVALAIAEASPGAAVVGVDQSEPMMRAGIERVDAAGLSPRIGFVQGDGQRLPFAAEAFDAVSFTYLLRYVEDPAATLAELARVLRPGGTLANLEFHVPRNPVWWSLWWLWTRVGLPIAGRGFGPAWGRVGGFLGPSISAFYRRHPLEEQLAMWRAAGVPDVRARVMSVGGGVVIWGTKAGP